MMFFNFTACFFGKMLAITLFFNVFQRYTDFLHTICSDLSIVTLFIIVIAWKL
jgi:hypothetical protein